MAFSLLTNKWRVLNAPLQTSLACSSDICIACARLHNYCIDMDHHQYHHMTTVLLTGAFKGWHHTTVHYRLIPGKSMTRDMILLQVAEQGMRQPNANLERRRYKLHKIGLM
jgi:hypothetical protein